MNVHKAFLACALIAGGGVVLFAAVFLSENGPSSFLSGGTACPGMEIQEEIVRGQSLAPLVEDGETIQALLGYYACNPIAREDLVLFRLAGNEDLLIKIVKGIPGDTLALEKGEGGLYFILVNGTKAVNSQGLPYAVNNARAHMLSLYINDYGGAIPPDAYLILGDMPSGSRDSTTFGLVGKSDIAGKAIAAGVSPDTISTRTLSTRITTLWGRFLCFLGRSDGLCLHALK